MSPNAVSGDRPNVVGKFLHIGPRRFLINRPASFPGVAYGTFAPGLDGYQFPALVHVASDFELMSQFSINSVRTYTVPRRELLDEAERHGLRVFVGIPWTQHVAFLDSTKLRRAIRKEVTDHVRALSCHPATLLIAIGNEIPQGIVRWHGRERVERFLRELYDEAKSAAPDTPITYVNYPPTEYLDLPFLDVCAFNLYLHQEQDLRKYLAHLQLIAGNRPLLLTEAGADSIREGEEGQAALTAMQLRTAFEEGACGAVAYSWTDDWWRGGHAVDDWAFGLTDVKRRPKLALFGVAREFADAGFPSKRQRWPKVSVLVCAYNAAETIDGCLRSLGQLDYPDFEVIVVNDGSRDATGTIAKRYSQVRVIETENQGLSTARNTALEYAEGEIVAYTDADVRVDQDWLTYLIQPFLHSDVVGAGGPNEVPAEDPWFAQCVARSPGGPIHVLIDERRADHVPGCNMAYRREALLDIGGFDPTYRVAGDDVDVCWRLQARGHHIGFAPSALVWHHHRNSVRAYWRQQAGYGEAETWLMEHHPERFLDGNALWRGRIYSPLPFIKAISRVRINAGIWGTAAFPSVYCTHIPSIGFLPHLIQWQLLSLLLAFGGLGGLLAERDGLALLLLLLAGIGLATTMGKCLLYSWQSDIRTLPPIGPLPRQTSRALYRAGITWLHFVQPIARAWGRLRGAVWSPSPTVGHAPTLVTTRKPTEWPTDIVRTAKLIAGRRPRLEFWNEQWVDRTEFLTILTNRLRTSGIGRTVDVHDGWQENRDVAVAVGRWCWLDLRTLVEEHARGRCLLRIGACLRLTPLGATVIVSVLSAVGLGVAFLGPAGLLAIVGTASGAILAWRSVRSLGHVEAGVRAIIEQIVEDKLDMVSLSGRADAGRRPGVAMASQKDVHRAPDARRAPPAAAARVSRSYASARQASNESRQHQGKTVVQEP